MESKLLIAENGTILAWNVGGIDVLAPHRQALAVGDSRGGLPVCVPMFSVQQREVAGSRLPLHGILMYEDLGETKTLENGQHWEKKFSYAPSERFNWKWNAEIQVALKQHTLTYSLTITRDEDDSNEEDMPYSLGFHPYFNTFGGDFSYEIAGHTIHKQEVSKDIIDSAFASLIPGESAVLTTSRGKLTITPEGYDEYCLWSDNINAYFCIEPIYQYREYGLPGTLLKKGESHTTSVTLHFKPLSQ